MPPTAASAATVATADATAVAAAVAAIDAVAPSPPPMKIWEDCERTLQAYLESSGSFNADPYCAVVSALVQRGESARQFAHFQSLAVDGALATICPRLASPETFAGLNGTTTCAEFATEYRKICDAQRACCEGPGHGLVDDWCNGGHGAPPGPPTAAPTPPPPPPSMPPVSPPSPPVIPPDIIAGYVLLAVGGACICAYAVALVCLCCCRKKKPVAARYEEDGEEGAEPAEVEDDIDPLEEFGGMDGDGAARGRDEGATDGFDAGRPASGRSRSPSRVSFGREAAAHAAVSPPRGRRPRTTRRTASGAAAVRGAVGRRGARSRHRLAAARAERATAARAAQP